jgi:predicted nucleic acid-binding protein
MTRSEHLTAAGVTNREVNTLLDAVVVAAEPVRLAFSWRPSLKDPDDDMVLETAVNGRADRLVTFNRRDFGTIGLRFGLVACSPGEAVKLLEDRE